MNTVPRTLQDQIKQKIAQVASVADLLPGVVIVHRATDFSIRYMNKRGLAILATTQEELIAMGPEYHSRFFNHEQTVAQLPKLTKMLESGDDESMVSLFQEVRRSPEFPWNLYCSSMNVLLRDEAGAPVLALTVAIPIDPEHHLAGNVTQLLGEMEFFKKHNVLFGSLSRREKLVLVQLAQGKSSTTIGSEMHLSPLTVDTYRRNIKKKLGVRTPHELWQFAKVFGLL